MIKMETLKIPLKSDLLWKIYYRYNMDSNYKWIFHRKIKWLYINPINCIIIICFIKLISETYKKSTTPKTVY